jgi:hypothetical protein
MHVGNVRKLLFYMARDGEVEKVGRGRYQRPGGNDGNDGNVCAESPADCASQDVTAPLAEGNGNGNDQLDVTDVTGAPDRPVTKSSRRKSRKTAKSDPDVTDVTNVTADEASGGNDA